MTMRKWLRRLSGRARREDGNATIEFVLMFPLVMTTFLCTVEAGWMMTRWVMMERSIDRAVRDLRLGIGPTSHDELKDLICDRVALIDDCKSVVRLDLTPVNGSAFPTGTVPCVDRSAAIQPVTDYIPGQENQMMLVRICVVVDPIFPTTAWGLKLPLDGTGGFRMYAMSAFVNEPDT